MTHMQGGPEYPAAPPPSWGYPQPPPRQSNGLAIASLVCGIVGMLFFGIVLGPLAVIFGAVGLSRANRGASGRGQAIAGLILGIVATVLAIVILAAVESGSLVI
jgi:hypothetical protein